MTLSLGAPAAGAGWPGRGNAAMVSDAAGAVVVDGQPEIGESVTILSPSTR